MFASPANCKCRLTTNRASRVSLCLLQGQATTMVRGLGPVTPPKVCTSPPPSSRFAACFCLRIALRCWGAVKRVLHFTCAKRCACIISH